MVSSMMKDATPVEVEQRRRNIRTLQRMPYRASHFGHKLHMDQNEKLLQYGVFQAACIDGFSSCIIRHVILPQKNCILLYDQLYKPVVQEYGVWDTLRVDYGTEWYLILYAQNQLGQYRRNTDKPSYCQTYSKKNLRIERWWVEVNKAVNYPMIRILGQLDKRFFEAR